MNYTVLNLMLCGLFGILVHTLMKINSINKKTKGNFKYQYFFKVEWASILISISIVTVALIARSEIKELSEIGNYLMLGFFCIGLASQSIAYYLSNKLEKRIETSEALSKLDGSECLGIKDTSTGLWLTSWDAATQTATWGSEQDALCLSEDLQSAILAILNVNTNNFIGARPRKPQS